MIFSKEKKNWKKLLKINFLRKIRYPPPIFRVFYMNFIHNFSYSGNRGTQPLAFDAFFWIFLNFFFFLLIINFFSGKLVKPRHVRPFYIDFTIEFSYFGNKRPPNPFSTWNFDSWKYDIKTSLQVPPKLQSLDSKSLKAFNYY